MDLIVNDTITLELTSAKHAEGLFAAVDNNRAHLSGYLPWVDFMESVSDFTSYVKNCEKLYLLKEEVSFVIIYKGDVVGRIGLHHINMQNKIASIGYWLTKVAEGKGIITLSCKKIISYGFEKLHLHRIEIKAAVDNIRSRAIPEKLHFTKEGILRQAELVNGSFLDLYLYSMLRFEWKV